MADGTRTDGGGLLRAGFEAALNAPTPLEPPSDVISRDGAEAEPPKEASILRSGFESAAPPTPPPGRGQRGRTGTPSAPAVPVTTIPPNSDLGTIFQDFFRLLSLLFTDIDRFTTELAWFNVKAESSGDPVSIMMRDNLVTMRGEYKNAGSTYEERYAYYQNLFKDNDLMQAGLKFLGPKEGFRNFIYRDSEGHLTAGMGHLMTDADFAALGLNRADVEKRVGPEKTSTNPREKIYVDQEILDTWQMADTAKALDAATKQAAELGIRPDGGIGHQAFIVNLTSVNFQLGTAWKDESNKRGFSNTWQLIEDGNYDAAISNIQNSLWMKQTPVRAKELVEAIESLKTIRPNGQIVQEPSFTVADAPAALSAPKPPGT